MSSYAASQLWRLARERARFAGRLAGTRAECGLPAAQLLSAVSLVVAGRDQGGVPGPRQHRRAVRSLGAQPIVGDAAAERRVAEIVRQADDAPGVYPLQRVFARSVRVPILF